MIEISISKDFTKCPGGAFRKDGKFSGEEFREDILKPKWKKAQEKGEKLIVNMDGGYGYSTSFIREAFYIFAFDEKDFCLLDKNMFEIINNEDFGLKDEIMKGIYGVLSCM